MSPELTKELVEQYPKLYRQYYLDMMNTCMCWGFEHGDGWIGILREMSGKLEPLGVECSQVKEKGGFLTVYLDYPTGMSENDLELANEIVDLAEIASQHICELCGAPGEINKKGYWKSCRCYVCREKER